MQIKFLRRNVARALPVALVVGGLMIAHPAQADVITFFDFNDSNAISDGGTRTSTITNSGTGNLVFGSTGGTAINADPDGSGPFPASTAGGALAYVHGNNTNSLQFALNTTGYQNLSLSFATESFNSGVNTDTLAYSLDGTNFINFSNYTSPDSTYALRTFDLSGIAGLNNNANAAFRIIFSVPLSNTTFPVTQLDNIAVQGTSTAVTATPEPETWAMMGLGVIALGIYSWRRKKDAPQASPSFGGLAV